MSVDKIKIKHECPECGNTHIDEVYRDRPKDKVKLDGYLCLDCLVEMEYEIILEEENNGHSGGMPRFGFSTGL